MTIFARPLVAARAAAAALGLALLAGCASSPPPPTQVTGTIQASPQIDPSSSKRPSPLPIRVYELKSAAAFNNADFMALCQRDQTELSTEMVGKEEYVLNPGDSKTFAKMLAPETRFIGVVAAFRDLEHAKWRGIVAIRPNQKQQVLIKAGELSIDATVTR